MPSLLIRDVCLWGSAKSPEKQLVLDNPDGVTLYLPSGKAVIFTKGNHAVPMLKPTSGDGLDEWKTLYKDQRGQTIEVEVES